MQRLGTSFSWLERCPVTAEVASSSLVVPASLLKHLQAKCKNACDRRRPWRPASFMAQIRRECRPKPQAGLLTFISGPRLRSWAPPHGQHLIACNCRLCGAFFFRQEDILSAGALQHLAGG